MSEITRGGVPLIYLDALGRRRILKKVTAGALPEPFMAFRSIPGASEVTVNVDNGPVRLVNPVTSKFVEYTVSGVYTLLPSDVDAGAATFVTLQKTRPSTGQSWAVSLSFGEDDDGGVDPTPDEPIVTTTQPTLTSDGRIRGGIVYKDPVYSGGRTGHTLTRAVEFYAAATGGSVLSTSQGIPAKVGETWTVSQYFGLLFTGQNPDGSPFTWRTSRVQIRLAAGPSAITKDDIAVASGIDASTNLANSAALTGSEYRPRWSFTRDDLIGSTNRPVAGEVGYRFTSSTQANPNPIHPAKLAGGNDANGEPYWTTDYPAVNPDLDANFDPSYVTPGDTRSKRLTVYVKDGPSEWSTRGDEIVTAAPAGLTLADVDWGTSVLTSTILTQIMNTTHSTWDYSADWGGWNGTQGRLAAFDNAHTFPMTVLAAAIGLRSVGNSTYARFRNTYATKNAAGSNVNQTPLQRAVACIKYWGGTSQCAPVMQGGFPPQGEIAYVATCLMFKTLLPEVWDGTLGDDGTTTGPNKITALERSRIDWAMKAYGAVASYFASDDYPFKAFGFPAIAYPANIDRNPDYTDGDRNIRGHSANTTTNAVPNFYYPIRMIVYLVSQWMGGAVAFQNFLWGFDVDEFLATAPTPIGANDEAYKTLNNMQWTAEKIRVEQGETAVRDINGWYFPGPTKAQFKAAINRVINTTTGAKAPLRLRVRTRSATTLLTLNDATLFASDAIHRMFNGTVRPGLLNRFGGEAGPDTPYKSTETTNVFGVKRKDQLSYLAGCFWPKTRWKDIPHKDEVCLPNELDSSDGGGNSNDSSRSSVPYVWKGTNGCFMGVLALMASGALDKSDSRWTETVSSMTAAVRLQKGVTVLKFMDGGYRSYSKGGGTGNPSDNSDSLGEWKAPSSYMLESRYALLDLCREWIEA